MRNKGKSTDIINIVKPVALGLLAAFAVTALLIAAFSLVFLALESIYESAVLPLALVAAAAGSFFGAYLCASLTKSMGLVYGCVIGAVMFGIIWLIGVLGADTVFGTLTALKLAILLISGAIGGWLGCERPLFGKWRRK